LLEAVLLAIEQPQVLQGLFVRGSFYHLLELRAEALILRMYLGL